MTALEPLRIKYHLPAVAKWIDTVDLGQFLSALTDALSQLAGLKLLELEVPWKDCRYVPLFMHTFAVLCSM